MLVSTKLDVEVHLFLGEIIQLPLKGNGGSSIVTPVLLQIILQKNHSQQAKGEKKCMVSTLDTTQLLPVVTV